MRFRRAVTWVALLSGAALLISLLGYTLTSRSEEESGAHHHAPISDVENRGDLSGEFLRAPLGVLVTFFFALIILGVLRWRSRLYGRARSWPPQYRLAALGAFLVVIIAAPLTQWQWGAGCGAVVLLGAYVSGVPLISLMKRLSIETPFLIFTVALPFLSGGPYVTLGPLTLSQPGLTAMLSILITSTLSVAATITVVSSMSVMELLHGAARLRVPSPLLLITAFALRYTVLIRAQWTRLQQARSLRGSPSPLTPWYTQYREYGQLIATVLITAYTRAERVHHSMLARGYRGDTHFLSKP